MTLAEYFGRDERSAFVDVVSELKTIRSARDFASCIEELMPRLLPHVGMVGGIGRARTDGIEPLQVVHYRFPEEYLATLRRQDGSIDSPALHCWRTRRVPIAFRAEDAVCAMPPALARRRHETGGSVLAHGQIEADGGTMSYFSFNGIAQMLGSRHAVLMRYLVPHLHDTLLQVAAHAGHGGAGPAARVTDIALTDRQREVLCFLHRGLSNKEIARLLATSEHNVKYLVGQIIRRLNVTNRVEAVARAVHLRLVDDT